MMTAHFTSSKTGMLNTTKYSKSIKNGKFRGFPFISIHYWLNDTGQQYCVD